MTIDNLIVILNKLHAMHAAKIVTFKQIADALGTREQRIGEWVARRTRRPSGESAIKLLSFTADQTTKIALAGRPMQKRYRAAYLAAQAMFPDEGRKS